MGTTHGSSFREKRINMSIKSFFSVLVKEVLKKTCEDQTEKSSTIDLAIQFTSDQHQKIHDQALRDLTIRSRGGIIIYPTVWFVTAIWADIIHISPKFFYFNTILLIVISILRTIHNLALTRRSDLNSAFMYDCLVSLILIAAFHWGILSSWIIFGGTYQKLHYPYMVILAGFAIGGTSVLSISRLISFLYPLFIFCPTLIINFSVGGKENYVLGLLAILSIIYVLYASRASHNDYHKAIFNHMVAEERAKIMEEMSTTDPLTGLKNRMYFNNQFAEKWKTCIRFQLPIAVLMIDLDHFKKINDTYGHISGDECLRRVATVLKSEIQRSTDTVARYGGEEFVVVLPDTNQIDTTIIAKSLVESISRIELFLNNTLVHVTCSIGVACMVPSHHDNAEALLILADNALYQAKEQGRNQYYLPDIAA